MAATVGVLSSASAGRATACMPGISCGIWPEVQTAIPYWEDKHSFPSTQKADRMMGFAGGDCGARLQECKLMTGAANCATDNAPASSAAACTVALAVYHSFIHTSC